MPQTADISAPSVSCRRIQTDGLPSRDNGWMSLSLCLDVSASEWLVGQDMPWYQLSATGPVGFPAYARLRFLPDPVSEGQSESVANLPDDALDETEQFGLVLEALSRYTSTPEDCYFCFWEGWGFQVAGDDIPMVKIPNRNYWLFRGSPKDFSDLGDEVRFDRRGVSEAPSPAYIWPADQAWCVTRDVDPHFAVIAGPAEAVEFLVADRRIDAVISDPRTAPPRYY